MIRPNHRLRRSRQLVGEAIRKARRHRALRQLDLAELVNVDHSVISRVETGQTPIDPSLINAIRRALNLNEAEWKWLETCMARCALDTAGTIDTVAMTHRDVLDISSASLRAAIELRAVGNSALAAITTYPVARSMRDMLTTSSSDSVRHMLAAELCELLFHETKCYFDYLPVDGISRLAIPVANRLFAIAREYPTARCSLLVGIINEGLLYFNGKYDEADGFARALMALELASEWRPEIVRAAAINAGHLGDEVSIRRHEKEVRALIGAGVSPMDHVFMLDGLARGYARLGSTRAIDVIEEAWDVQLDATRQSTLRYVQKVRAHLEVNDQLGRDHDGYLREQADAGLRVARSMGYERYVADLMRLTGETGAVGQ